MTPRIRSGAARASVPPASARGIGQAELGRRVGATQSLIGQIECGRILRSKYETLIMFELGIPLDPETERWILASRQSGAGAGAGAAQGAQDPAPGDAAEQDAAAQPANAHAPAAPVPIRPSPADASAAARGGGSTPTTSSSPPSGCASAASAARSSRWCSTARSATSTPSSRRRRRRPARCARSSSRAASRAARPMWAAATIIAPAAGAGQRVFILTHEEQATRNLFEMVERFHDTLRRRAVDRRGQCAASCISTRSTSGYTVGTAGTRGVGRSATLQLLHGSEVAFWPHAETHAAGVLQAVADEPGTEVILELTANGVGNLFHQMWRDAETGANDYIAVFVPWFWQEEYRKPLAAPDFMLTAEEHDYAALYGLDDEQMAWRRSKIAELEGRRACSRRNIRRPPPRRSRCPATTASSRPR